MFTTLVQPHFDYCGEIWGCCNKPLFIKLQKLQNRAARILLRASYDTNADSIIDKLDWRKLDTQRQISKYTMYINHSVDKHLIIYVRNSPLVAMSPVTL